MKNKKYQKNRARTLLATAVVGGSCWLGAVSSQAAITGQWDFNNAANPLQATVGAPLEYFDGVGGATESGTQVGSTTALGLPNIGDQPANVMVFPKCTPLMGYYIIPGIPENGPSGKGENYTLLMDILWPAASTGKWRSLIQISDVYTNPNTTDGELFVNTGNGIGIGGAYSGALLADTWHRVAFVKEGTRLSKYIDGVFVGAQTLGAAGADWNFEPHPNGLGILFGDNDDETESGVLNSLQFHDVALSQGQIVALGGPQAAGLPQVLPDVPSFVESWIPAGPMAPANTEVGAVINAGSSTITNIRLSLDGSALGNVQTSQEANVITARATPAQPFAAMTDHVIVLTFDDNKAGTKSATNSFRVPLFFEDFESIALGPNVDEALAGTEVYSPTPPTGWTVDHVSKDGLTPLYGFNPIDPANGVTEFRGWTFLNRDWWAATAGDQRRTEYVRGVGTVAVADPDEWDDKGDPDNLGTFNSKLITPAVNIATAGPDTAFLAFDSSTRSEEPQEIYITVAYDGGAETEILRWTSNPGPTLKADAPNERVVLSLNNPAGANTVTVTFGLEKAENDWWWAIDNIAIDAGSVAPEIAGQPASATRLPGGWVNFSVSAVGAGLSYQWQKDQVDIAGANAASYLIDPVTAANQGAYRCVVSNSGGSVTSEEAVLTVIPVPQDVASLQNGLGAYLPFDNDYADASGNNRNGTPVGNPTFASGKVGTGAVQITNQGTSRNYVTLGQAASSAFGQTTDFSVAFWMKTDRVSSDPVVVGNKDWDSGGNTGWLIGTQADGRIEWNYKRSTETRKDLDTVIGNILNNGRWAHVTVVWNINGDALTYYDGFLVNQQPISPGNGDISAAGTSLNLGQDGMGDYGSEWDGLLDDVAFWNRALTADEVLALYGTGLQGFSFLNPPPPQPTLGYSLAGGQLTLTWQGEGFALEENGNLGNPAGWSNVQGAGANSATVPTATGTKFYRLKK
jgi:hypothetical protein